MTAFPRSIGMLMLAWMLLAFLGMSSQQVYADNSNLNKEIDELAKQVVKFLEDKGENQVAIGEWTGPASPPSSSGPAIKKALIDALEHQTLTIAPKGKFTIKGDYGATTDKESGMLVVRLNARMLDSQSQDEVFKFSPRGVNGEKELAKAFGLTASLSPNDDKQERNDKLKNSLNDPSVHIEGLQVMSAPNSPYRVEVLTKSSPSEAGEARQPKELDGLAFVDIKRNEFYEARLINDSEHDAAVTLSIDGIDVFEFSNLRDAASNKPRYTCWVIPKKSSYSIKGWHRTNKQVDSFVVMEFAKSEAAKRLGSSGSSEIGTITMTFAAAWDSEMNRPKDEGDAKDGGDATGRGPSIEIDTKEVQRTFGKIRSCISIRYTKPE